MEDALLEKLAPYLSSLPKCEADVVYTLVEIRKLLDRDREYNLRRDASEPILGGLRFFCDWAVHIRMNRVAATQILKEIDTALQARQGGKSDALEAPFSAIFGLQQFRSQLQEFCGSHGFSTVWTDDTKSWTHVMGYYGEVVKDCHVVIKTDRPSTKLIEQLVLADVERMYVDEREEGFYFDWQMTYRNGKTERVQVNCLLRAPFIQMVYWDV